MAIVEQARVAELPAPVRRSLRRSGAIGQPVPETVVLAQRGEILLRNRWFPFSATECYSLAPAGVDSVAASSRSSVTSGISSSPPSASETASTSCFDGS